MKEFWPVFMSIFIAELGDKTQVATLLFATEGNLSRMGVFAAASGALVLSSLIAVVFGSQISGFVAPQKIKWIAGIGFIAIGIWTLLDSRA